MGLLDDAIREHLELKRLRGADPSDVIRQEREALGAATQEDPLEEPFGSTGDGGATEASSEHEELEAQVDEQVGDVADDLWTERTEVRPAPSDAPKRREKGSRTDQETAEVDMAEMLDIEELDDARDDPSLHGDALDESEQPHAGSWGEEGDWGGDEPSSGQRADEGADDEPEEWPTAGR